MSSIIELASSALIYSKLLPLVKSEYIWFSSELFKSLVSFKSPLLPNSILTMKILANIFTTGFK